MKSIQNTKHNKVPFRIQNIETRISKLQQLLTLQNVFNIGHQINKINLKRKLGFNLPDVINTKEQTVLGA